jgi:hypothetical protein
VPVLPGGPASAHVATGRRVRGLVFFKYISGVDSVRGLIIYSGHPKCVSALWPGVALPASRDLVLIVRMDNGMSLLIFQVKIRYSGFPLVIRQVGPGAAGIDVGPVGMQHCGCGGHRLGPLGVQHCGCAGLVAKWPTSIIRLMQRNGCCWVARGDVRGKVLLLCSGR